MKELFPFVQGTVLKLKPKTYCFMAPIHAVITPTGKVLTCCYFTEDKYVIGNAFIDGFKNVWNSEKHIKVIHSIKQEHCAKFDCRFHKYNDEMLQVIENNKHNLSFI